MTDPILQTDKLSLMRQGRLVIKELSFALKAGEMLAVIGPNGIGKSSLILALAGLLPPHSGQVTLMGKALPSWPAKRRAQILGYLPQGQEIHWPLTVQAVVELGRQPYLPYWPKPAHFTKADRQAIEQAIHLCDIDHLRHRSAQSLSGGEQARVLLARLLAGTTNGLLVDEPIRGLDPSHQLKIMDIFQKRAQAGETGKGAGIIIALHDLTLARRYCDRALLIGPDGTAHIGPCEEIMNSPHLEDIYKTSFWRGGRPTPSHLKPMLPYNP